MSGGESLGWCLGFEGGARRLPASPCPACLLQGLLLSHTLHHNPEPYSSSLCEVLQQGNCACGGGGTSSACLWPRAR